MSKPTFEEYLRQCAVSKDIIRKFVEGPGWSRFDHELGYVLSNYMRVNGVDGSATLSTVQSNGARSSFMYTNKPCRINTYGNSFTESEQVSDGESWQEYLAAHICEPIRNFGVGGFGVYQAYRRMIREESTEHGADNIIFYIWGDDHIRSLFRCRFPDIYPWFDKWSRGDERIFQANYWSNIEMDLESGLFVEKPQILSSADELHRMSDPHFLSETLKDDMGLQLKLFGSGRISSLDRKKCDQLAACFDFRFDWSQDNEGLKQQALKLLELYSLNATICILKKVNDFAKANNKNLLVSLFDPSGVMRKLLENSDGSRKTQRYDQIVVDYLEREGIDYFDMNVVHALDYKKYNLGVDDYLKEYLIGHYNPKGNHFFAHSIKDRVIEMLDPKPITYSRPDAASIDFDDYLPYS